MVLKVKYLQNNVYSNTVEHIFTFFSCPHGRKTIYYYDLKFAKLLSLLKL